MKTIIITNKKFSLKLKAVVFLTAAIAIVSFFLSVKYINDHGEDTQLKLDVQLLPPQCVSVGGFYGNAFSLSLIPHSGEKIYYTLDGSEPSLRSLIYMKPIIIQDHTGDFNEFSRIPTSPHWKPPVGDVFKGTVLRAISVADDKKSKELVRTFFVSEKGKKKYSIPVIALTVNPEDFFGYKNGIYVLGKSYEDKDNYIRKNISLDQPWWTYPSNYSKRGENSERLVHIEYYRPDGSLGFEEYAGVRINGNRTRGLGQKSLRIMFSEQYGSNVLNYQLFPNYNVSKFNSFILRNSGNDWNKTMFRDAFMQSLMIGTKVETQRYCPAIVFINAEYWGIHNIRERIDENYLSNKYNLNKDSVVILESGKVFYGKKQDSEKFKQLLSFVKSNDLSLPANYQYIKEQIDLDNFMDFIIANVYFCNGDWQEKCWRFKNQSSEIDSLDIRDGRWRWILYDTDWGFGYTGADAVKINLLEVAKNGEAIGVIFNGLLKNDFFLDEFNKRFHYHLNNTFNNKRVLGMIDQFENTLKPEITEHIDRWREIGSYNNWESFVQELKKFAIERPAIQTEQLNDFIVKNKKTK